MKKRRQKVEVLYEDEHLVAVAKPPRFASVPARDIPLHKSMMGLVQEFYRERNCTPYILHRLDAHTSGILLFGKVQSERAALEGIFSDVETHKKYIALVQGMPHGTTIVKKLKSRHAGTEVDAHTAYKTLHIFKNKQIPLCALIEAKITTGRKHQIRQHFAMIRHPIVLDSKYGDMHFNRKFRIRFRLGRQFLHAASISFMHPFLKKRLTIDCRLPQDLQSTLKKLHCGR